MLGVFLWWSFVVLAILFCGIGVAVGYLLIQAILEVDWVVIIITIIMSPLVLFGGYGVYLLFVCLKNGNF